MVRGHAKVARSDSEPRRGGHALLESAKLPHSRVDSGPDVMTSAWWCRRASVRDASEDDEGGRRLSRLKRFEARAHQFNRWASRHWILTGLLIAALAAVGLFLRWSRYNDIFGDSDTTAGDLIPLIVIFVLLPPVCMFVAWRAGRRVRTRMAAGPPQMEGEVPVWEFDLVAAQGELQFEGDGWTRARSLLVELQPAKRVTLVGDPPSRIRVETFGGVPEVEPAVLRRLETLAGVGLQFETR